MKIMNLHLAGSTFHDGQKFLHTVVSNGQTLLPANFYLVREKDEPHYKNAVQIWYKNGEEDIMLGYVSMEQSAEVADCLDDYGGVNVVDYDIVGSSDSYCGLWIKVNMIYLSDYKPMIPDDVPEVIPYEESDELPDYYPREWPENYCEPDYDVYNPWPDRVYEDPFYP